MKLGLLIAASTLGMFAVSTAVSAAPIYSDTLGPGAISVNPTDFSARLTPISSSGLTISGGVNYGNAQFGSDQSYLDDPGAISLTFDAPVSAFGFDFTTIGANPNVSAYDAANNLLESDIFSVSSLPQPQGYPTGYAGISGLSGISHVIISTANGPDSILIGTVSFVPSAVPEPASWAMMLGGFGLVGGAMRGRRKSAVSFG